MTIVAGSMASGIQAAKALEQLLGPRIFEALP